MPSIIVESDLEGESTRKLNGNLRGIARARAHDTWLLVGDRGAVLLFESGKINGLSTGTKENLRSVAFNPVEETALVAGNAGTVYTLRGRRVDKVEVPTTENLRTLSWSSDGRTCLLAGNRGTLLRYHEGKSENIGTGRANLRRISWRPNSRTALVTSNCFAEEFVPSPSLFEYEDDRKDLMPRNEGRADLIGVDWNSDGKIAIVVGYDVVWHTGFIGTYEGEELTPVRFENQRVYPVAVKWNPSRNLAAIATAATQPGVGSGAILLWESGFLKEIYRNDKYFFSGIDWNSKGTKLVAVASTQTRTFNC